MDVYKEMVQNKREYAVCVGCYINVTVIKIA